MCALRPLLRLGTYRRDGLGWTHSCGSGKSIARIVSGLEPEVDFAFTGA
jgi:diaminopimelate epimerase